MGKGGIDRLIADAQEILGTQIANVHNHQAPHYGSPIEALFGRAMAVLIRLEPPDMTTGYTTPILRGEDFTDPEYLTLYEGHQVRCLDWPVDFVFVVKDFADNVHQAVVECDGHEFHERTKDQAKRDRSRDRRLQEAGFRVFRFTGSEIYRDPMACAREVFRWAHTCWSIGLPE